MTEPNLSHKHGETVCTAGITAQGEWLRLYPIQGRVLKNRFHKYQWIECLADVVTNGNDVRSESRRVDVSSITPCEKVGVEDDWAGRRRLLETVPMETNLQHIRQAAKRNEFSLCLFRPAGKIHFSSTFIGEDFTPEEQEQIRNLKSQKLLLSFDDVQDFSEVPFIKVPYDFYCTFEDDQGQPSKLKILDWEIKTLYRKSLKNHTKEEADALTLQRYEGFLKDRELVFVLGTRNEAHKKLIYSNTDVINPWSIIAVIPLPKSYQQVFNFS